MGRNDFLARQRQREQDVFDAGMRIRRHISMSVRGAIGMPDSELKTWIGNLYDDETGEPLRSVREIRLALAEALAEGCEYIRNQECDNFDPKRGCLGHSVEEDT